MEDQKKNSEKTIDTNMDPDVEFQNDSKESKFKSTLASKLICTAFPVAAWIILIHELLERFSFYGMKGILTLYLRQLGFNDDTATAIYHLFTGCSYLTPILGGFLSDNYWGKFKTIVILGIVYLIGHALMPATAIMLNVPGPMIAIFVVALGTGGIKPCVAAFGGDQIPTGNDVLLDVFFSLFYMMINIGAFASQLLTPILREIPCLGSDKCYALGFGVPAAVFAISFILFILGKPTYKIEPKPAESVLNKTFACVFYAIKMKFKRDKNEPKKEQFLDYAEGKYSKDFIKDVKVATSVLFLFIPFPIYWALFDQQGSRWTLQATTMDGYITEDFNVQPDQMQTVNPLLIVLIIPLFNNIVYPLLNKCNMMKSPTSRIFAGYLICSMAFMLTGVMDLIIEREIPPVVMDAPHAQLRYFNDNPCAVTVSPTHPGQLDFESFRVNANATKEIRLIFQGDIQSIDTTYSFMSVSGSCLQRAHGIKSNLTVGKYYTIFAKEDQDSTYAIEDNRVVNGNGKVRIVLPKNLIPNNNSYIALGEGSKRVEIKTFKVASLLYYYTEYVDLTTRKPYNVHIIDDSVNSKTKLFDVYQDPSEKLHYRTLFKSADGDMFTITELSINLIHRTWQLPQYFLMCLSEVLFSVTAMAFAYSESPPSLKSLLQTFYLITIFFGNMIVLIVALLPALPKRAYEFFMFGCLVFVGGFIQLIIIYYYNKNKKLNAVQPIEIDEKNTELTTLSDHNNQYLTKSHHSLNGSQFDMQSQKNKSNRNSQQNVRENSFKTDNETGQTVTTDNKSANGHVMSDEHND